MDAAPSTEERISAYFAAEEPSESPPNEVAEESEQGAADAALSDPAPEETEEVVEGADAEDEPDGEKAEADDEDVISVSDISELSEHFGIDVAEMYELLTPVTGADGKKKNVSIGALKDAYQANEQATKVQKQAQEEYDALMRQRQQFEQQAQEAAAKTARYIQSAKSELTQEFNAINWDQLKAEDPGQYAARRQDFIERNARLGQLEQQASQEWQQQQQQLQEQRQAQLGQYLQREQQALVEAVPEWRNEEAAQAEKAKVSEYLQSSGYTPQELSQAYDHRAIVLARKAMLWDESQKKADVAKQKVLKIGKRVLKPSTRQSKATQKTSRERELKAAMRQSGGKLNDAAALIQARLGR